MVVFMGHVVEPEDIYRSLGASGPDTAVSVILKLRGETCDIDCLYCYEKRKEKPGGARIAPGDIGRLAQLFRQRPLAIELHGGEPLTLGKPAMREILLALAAQPKVCRVSMQTNGIQLDDEWLDIFAELVPDLYLGISLDGDAEGNNWRVGYDGQPTHGHVERALELLARRAKKVGIISAVTPLIVDRPAAIIDYFANFAAVNAISFVPVFDAGVRQATAVPSARIPASRMLQQASIQSTGGADWATTPAEYAEFVLRATHRWIERGHFRLIKLEPAVSTIRRLKGQGTSFCHFSDLKCDHVFTLYPKDRLGSCDELPWPQAALIPLGTAHDEAALVQAQKRSPLLAKGRLLMSKCSSCSYQQTCGGGCVATRLRAEGTDSDAEYCDYRMRLIDGIAGLLASPSKAPVCRKVKWYQRQPNTMRDVAGFLQQWNEGAVPQVPSRLATSTYGNINTIGAAGIHEADDLTPTSPQWRECIEPGIWPLVDVITRQWGAVTYDSCEGHDYPELDIERSFPRVGLIPRSSNENGALAAALCRVVASTAATLPSAVSVHIERADLNCETTMRQFPVLDLSIRPATGTNLAEYNTQVISATKVLSEALSGQDPRSNDDCACSD